METKHSDFMENLATLVKVLIAESTTPDYIITYDDRVGRHKTGSRRKVYLFTCLNCKELSRKKSKAKYCSDRCRKEAERKRLAAAQFFKAHETEVLEFLKKEGQHLVKYCDKTL